VSIDANASTSSFDEPRTVCSRMRSSDDDRLWPRTASILDTVTHTLKLPEFIGDFHTTSLGTLFAVTAPHHAGAFHQFGPFASLVHRRRGRAIAIRDAGPGCDSCSSVLAERLGGKSG